MDIVTLLKNEKAPFRTTRHPPTFTAQELAAAEHTCGDHVAKVVLIRAGQRHAMLVLPASYNVRFDRVNRMLGVHDARLATEEEISEIFPDCELGAMPPFGREYGLDVYVDARLTADDEFVFEAGHHDEAVRMKWADFQRIEHPLIADFATHLH